MCTTDQFDICEYGMTPATPQWEEMQTRLDRVHVDLEPLRVRQNLGDYIILAKGLYSSSLLCIGAGPLFVLIALPCMVNKLP